MQHPKQLAFVNTNQTLTYGSLWTQSENLSAYITKQTKQLGSPIIVYGHMEPEMLSAFLGCVKAGHPYIPVDTSIPMERILKIIERSNAEMIISIADLEIRVPSINLVNKEQFDKINCETVSISDSSKWVKDDENFYIIYTSGSTGNPKGVQISANNLQSFVDWMTHDFPITNKQRFLNQAPFSFDLSVMDIYSALATGGTIYAITKDMLAKPKELFVAFEQANVQVWTSTPSFVQLCFMNPDFCEQLLPELNTFLFCGEVLPVQTARQLLERFPKARIFNTYGPTETTVAVTAIEVTEELLDQYETLPVGACKNDSFLLIVNEDGETVSEGEKGEIIIVSPSVSKGYLGEPELTDKSFFYINGQMAYRTGDAGYLQNDLLFYKGRLDFQIKLHGYRMELEEIEDSINQSQYVELALVLPVYNGEKVDYLTAFIIPAKHSFERDYQLTSAIKKELGKLLPNYMIPRKFVYRTGFPVTANGKVDRNKATTEVMA